MKIYKVLPILVVLLIAPLGCLYAEEASKYKIRQGDVLDISVWGDATLAKVINVLPDGSISFPLAGNVLVAGLSSTEIEELIKKKLKTYLPDPEVTVIVQSTGGNKIYILGKVNSPGAIPLQGPTTVLQALSISGGFDRFADLDEIKVLRGKKVFEVNYKDLIQGENLETNYLLEANDTILVP